MSLPVNFPTSSADSFAGHSKARDSINSISKVQDVSINTKNGHVHHLSTFDITFSLDNRRQLYKLDLAPKLGDHCQPIDVLSGTDIDNAWNHEKYYHNTVTGSYNRFHRFFRIT